MSLPSQNVGCTACISALPVTERASLGKFLNLSLPQFPYLCNEVEDCPFKETHDSNFLRIMGLFVSLFVCLVPAS